MILWSRVWFWPSLALRGKKTAKKYSTLIFYIFGRFFTPSTGGADRIKPLIIGSLVFGSTTAGQSRITCKIRLVRKNLLRINTLAYSSWASVTNKKCFLALTHQLLGTDREASKMHPQAPSWTVPYARGKVQLSSLSDMSGRNLKKHMIKSHSNVQLDCLVGKFDEISNFKKG
jgi:hypothetical protein